MKKQMIHRLAILTLLKGSPGGVTAKRLSRITWRFAGRLHELRKAGHNILTKPTNDPRLKVYVLRP